MTEKRRLKKVIRARMARTGEAYMVARARLLGRPRPQMGNPSQGARMYPYNRFTANAQTALKAAEDEAERSHHSYIGTEHVLAGLLRVEDGLAAKALAGFGVTLPAVRARILEPEGDNQEMVGKEIIPASGVKKVVEIAFEEARAMGHNYVGTEHLLLALLVEGEGVAAHLLTEMGVKLETARPVIDKLLEESAEPAGERPVPVDREVRSILERAREIARSNGAEAVGVDHLREALG